MPEPNEVVTEQPPVTTEDNPVEGITEEVSDFDKLLAEQPKVKPDTETESDKGKKPEEKPDDDNEFDVKPKAKDSEKPEDKPKDESTAKPEGEEEKETEKPSDPTIRKIGDFELTEAEWVEAAFDRQNKSVWQKTLTQKSQLAAKILPKLTDDDLTYLMPYVNLQKELPENLKEAVLKNTNLPEKIVLNQDDGTEVEVFLKDLPSNFLGQIGKAAMAEIYPEFDKLKEDHTKLLEENNKIKHTQMTTNQRMIESEIRDLMKAEPDIAFDGGVRKSESIIDKLAMIGQVGQDHPEFKKAQRLMTIVQYANVNGMRIKDAYYEFFGKQKAEKEAKEQIIENQNNDTSRETGKKPSSKEDIETRLINEISGGDSAVLDGLGL